MTTSASFKNIEEMIRYTRKGCVTRTYLIDYVCKLVSNRSEEYDYYFEKNTLRRIDVNGNDEIVLKSKRNFIIIGYLFELEKFLDLDLEVKYKNLEAFYDEHGLGVIVKAYKGKSFYISKEHIRDIEQ